MKITKIHILSHLGISTAGTHPLYPLFRWANKLKESGVTYKVFRNHTDPALQDCDTVILIHRYFHHLYKTTQITNFDEVIKLVEKLKKNHCKVIFYDAGDSTGSREFALLPHVDKFIKKQILKDKSLYTQQSGIRIWLHDDGTTPENNYVTAEASDLYKIALGWNIGLADYRHFPVSRYLGGITNRVLTPPRFSAPQNKRAYDTSFRGTVKYNSSVADQRNKTIQTLEQLSDYAIIKGGKINRRKYLKELESTKITVSPFGWGELCYRDFEAFITGNILVKPSVDHIETYPDYFKNDHTYIPVKWDMSDLKEKIVNCVEQYNKYQEIAINGQNHFRKQLNDGDGFVKHLKNIILNHD